MFKNLNPFSAFHRKEIRDLEADLRGRGHIDETGQDPAVRDRPRYQRPQGRRDETAPAKAVRKPDGAA